MTVRDRDREISLRLIVGLCLAVASTLVAVLLWSSMDTREPTRSQTRIQIGEIRIDIDGNPRCWCGAFIVGGDGGRDGNSPRVICERGHLTAFGPE